jgi:tetratricopeptide (TPR) repeat protein
MEQDKQRLPRRRLAELEVQESFFRGLLARDALDTDVIEELADVLTQMGRTQEVIPLDQRLIELRPTDPDVRYNMACSLALLRDYERAANELSAAIELGFRDVDSLNSDPDLAGLRAHPAFRRVRACLSRIKGKPEP